MAELHVMRTVDSVETLLKELPKEDNASQLFIAALGNCAKEEKDYGDFLINIDSPNKFALIAKDHVGDKIIPEALRLSILNLIRYMLEEDIPVKTFLISRFQFISKKEEAMFICLLKEFLITYYGEVIKDTVDLIICDCKN